jgi:hypothetical protein
MEKPPNPGSVLGGNQQSWRVAHPLPEVLLLVAFNVLRIVDDKRSIKLRRKRAARNNPYLEQILQSSAR